MQLYVRYLLEDSVREPFSAFHRGFLLLCDGIAFSFLAPHELEELICGTPHLDFRALQEAIIATLLPSPPLSIYTFSQASKTELAFLSRATSPTLPLLNHTTTLLPQHLLITVGLSPSSSHSFTLRESPFLQSNLIPHPSPLHHLTPPCHHPASGQHQV